MFRRVLALMCLQAVAAAPLAAEWPTPYQNPRLTRTLQAKGALTAPSLRWKKRLGGANPSTLVQDVTGDGRTDVVTLTGGRAVCRDPATGALIWASDSLNLGYLLLDPAGRALDLDGDGHTDLLVARRAVGDTRLHVLHGQTGQVLWTFGEGLGPNSGVQGISVHLGNVDQDPQPEVILWVSQNQTGSFLYAFDFGEGFSQPAVQWVSESIGYFGVNTIRVFDAFGSGDAQVVVSSGNTLYVVNGATGAHTQAHPAWYGDHPAIPYGAKVVPVAGTESAPDLFMAHNFGNVQVLQGVWRLRADGPPEALWRQVVDTRLLTAQVVDLDNDGRDEIVTSTFNEQWTTRILDRATGATLSEAPGRVLTGAIADLTGDGRRELVLAYAPDDAPPDLTTLELARWVKGELVPAWNLDGASVAAAVDRDHDGIHELVLYRDLAGDGAADALQVVRHADDGPTVLATLAFAKERGGTFKTVADGIVGDEPAQLLLFAADGYLDVLSAQLTPVGQRIPVAGFAPDILASRLTPDGPMRVIVRDSTGRTLQVDASSGFPSEPPVHSVLFAANSARQVVTVWDVDHDGDRELFVLDQSGGQHRFLLLNADGTERWSLAPSGISGGLETPPGTGGDLDGDGVDDFYLQTVIDGLRTGIPVSGATGAPLGWSWQPYQPGGGTGTSYSPALLADFDGDGLADVVTSRYGDRLDGVASTPATTAASIRVMKGLTGELLSHSNLSIDPGRITLGQVDPTLATPDVLMTWWRGRGALVPPEAPAKPLATLWAHTVPGPITRGMPMTADLDGDGGHDLVHFDHTVGRIRALRGLNGAPVWPVSPGAVPGERQLAGGHIYEPLESGAFRDLATGTVLATLPATQLNERAILVTNLTGRGYPTAVFAASDGRIYAVNAAQGTLDWVYDARFAAAAMAPADTDGDGLVELLLTTDDGHLYALAQAAPVGTIAEVRDGVGADVDLVPGIASGLAPNRLSANWDAATGGEQPVTGYLVRVLTHTGAVVLDWQDVGLQTQVTLQGYVTLAPRVAYKIVVMPYGHAGAGGVFESDGFWFYDSDADGLMDQDEAVIGTDPYLRDSDEDGLPDGVEAPDATPTDTDGDQLIDALDLDSDADGLADATEGLTDRDGDLEPDYRDTDDDGDTLATALEIAHGKRYGPDLDADGIPHWYDLDSDGDGAPDADEGTDDRDGDSIPNYVDPTDDYPEAPPLPAPVSAVAHTESRPGCSAAPGPGAPGGVALALLMLVGWLTARRCAGRR